MKKALEVDLTDLSEILESFVTKLDKFTVPEIIDLAARLKPAAKSLEAIDKHVKELVKAKRKGKAGAVLGDMFKAVLTLVPTQRLDQKALKEDDPKIHAAYNKDVVDERVTFEVR